MLNKLSKFKFLSHYLLLLSILALALTLRFYRLDSPLADWHSWRQADTASVTREFVKHNYPIFKPHYHDLSNIPNGLDNPEGYRMVEFPIINYLTAQILRSNPQLDLVTTSRLVSIIASLVSIACIYGLVWNLSKDKLQAGLAALFFAILPYSIYYSRSILPEPIMVATQMLSLYCFSLYLDEKKMSAKGLLVYSISYLSLVLAFLLKPITVFLAPVYFILLWRKHAFSLFKQPMLYLYPTSILPLLLWRRHIQQFPEGIPAFDWLLNGNGIRLRPAWWRWIFADRIGRLILGYWGTGLAFAGIISWQKKLRDFDIFTLAYAFSMLIYMVVIATGNVQHDYYQIILTPLISILIARGFLFFWRLPKSISHSLLTKSASIFIVLLMLAFSWYEVKGYFNINNPTIVKAGQRSDQLVSENAQIIAPYMGDTAFLFQTNRRGWPIGGEIEKKISLGATHYLATTYDDEARELEAEYETVEKTSEYLLLDLRKKL